MAAQTLMLSRLFDMTSVLVLIWFSNQGISIASCIAPTHLTENICSSLYVSLSFTLCYVCVAVVVLPQSLLLHIGIYLRAAEFGVLFFVVYNDTHTLFCLFFF